MKGRESGMPEEALWATFFDPPTILARLGLDERVCDVAEFGCGYGTFTIPAAMIVNGIVHAFDLEPEMIRVTDSRAREEGLPNVRTHLCDFLSEKTDLPDAAVDYAMLFNILHVEDPQMLLREARRLLIPGGVLGVIHWNYDDRTPRGPSMDIRPQPAQCYVWAKEVGFIACSLDPVDLPPYHYGWSFIK